MELPPTNRKSRCGGFTLPELMVAILIGLFITVSAVSFYSFSVASFSAMSNFTAMGQRNRHASDIISRDIRSATSVATANATKFVLNAPASYGNNVTIAYNYSTNARTLTRVSPTVSQVILSNIVPNTLKWTMYTRPKPGSSNITNVTASAAAAKFVQVKWNCSQLVSTTDTNMTTMTTAKVELRNQQ